MLSMIKFNHFPVNLPQDVTTRSHAYLFEKQKNCLQLLSLFSFCLRKYLIEIYIVLILQL